VSGELVGGSAACELAVVVNPITGSVCGPFGFLSSLGAFCPNYCWTECLAGSAAQSHADRDTRGHTQCAPEGDAHQEPGANMLSSLVEPGDDDLSDAGATP